MEAGFTITKQGWHLLAKLLAGDKLEISKIMVGSGKVPEGVNPGEITELVRPVALATSTVPQVADKQVSFIVEYRNDLNGGLAEGFWLNEFGVYANDPDNGEILLYYATMGDYPQYVAAYNGQAVDVRRYPVVIALSECYNVELKPPAGAWVTFEELAETLKRRGYHSNLNLLINGDFRKPVNRNGKREYTAPGYTIDRWVVGAIEKATLQDGFITISVTDSNSSYESMSQSLPGKQFNNKSLTASILYRSKTIASLAMYNLTQNFWKAGINLPTSSAWNLVTLTKTFVEDDFGNDDVFGLNIYPSTIGQNLAGSIDIIAIKLEPGNQQTLAHKDENGNWVLNDPPNYDLQYALCNQYSPITGEFVGSQHSNPNLLDNAYWADKGYIINQRGLDEYTGAGYTIDRWRQDGRLRTQITDDYIRITKTELAYNPSFCQLLENFNILSNKLVTISFLYRTNITVQLTVNPNQPSQTPSISIPTSDDWNLFSYSFIVTGQTNNVFWFQFRNTITEENNYFDLRAAKLELGPVQTLAHKDENGNWVLNDPPPNKVLELAKCQRYQIELKKSNSDSNIGFGIANTTRNVTAFIPLPVSLRNKPIIANQKKVMCMGIFSTGYILQASVNVSVYSYTSSGIHVNCELVSNDYNFIQGNSYQVYLQLQQSQFLIDANL